MKVRILLILSMGIGLLGSCSRSTKSKSANTLRLAVYDHPYSYSPQKGFDLISSCVIAMLYEGLTRQTPGNVIELGIAEKVEVSEDRKTYTFYLKDVFWSNREKLTAFDFERSWKSHLAPSSTSLSARLFYDIKNAEKAKKDLVGLDEVGIKALDDKRLLVTLEHPIPYFLELTSLCPFLPFHCESEGKLISNGPFRIKKEKIQDYIILEGNPYYHERKNVHIEKIRIDIIKDENTAHKLFLQGKLDYLGDPLNRIPLDTLPKVKDSIKRSSIAATSRFIFNLQNPFLSNVHIRRAISYAIDREEIVNCLAPFPAIHTFGIVPPLLKGGAYDTLPPSRDEGINELEIGLKELECAQIRPFKVTFPNSEINRTVALILQSQLKEKLDLKVEIEAIDLVTYLQKCLKNDFDLLIGKWIAPFEDPISVLEAFYDGDDPRNFSKWSSLEFQNLIDASRETLEKKKRFTILNSAEGLISDEIPMLALFHYDFIYLVSERLDNFFLTHNGVIHFNNATLNETRGTPKKKKLPKGDSHGY